MNKSAKIRQSLILVVLLSAICAYSQETQPRPAPEGVQTRLYHIKNVDPLQLERVLVPFSQSGRATIVPNREFKTLTISGSPGVLAAIESMIQELDVAPPHQPSVEVTAYMLVATTAAAGDSKLPGTLDPVMKQLRATFQYRAYALLDTVLIRSLAGQGGSTMGVVGFPDPDSQGGNYSLRYDAAEVNRDSKGAVVRLRDLRLILERPRVTKSADGSTHSNNQVAGFTTSVDVKEGQMVVVGKSSLEAGDRALITVLAVKVLD